MWVNNPHITALMRTSGRAHSAGYAWLVVASDPLSCVDSFYRTAIQDIIHLLCFKRFLKRNGINHVNSDHTVPLIPEKCLYWLKKVLSHLWKDSYFMLIMVNQLKNVLLKINVLWFWIVMALIEKIHFLIRCDRTNNLYSILKSQSIINIRTARGRVVQQVCGTS